MLDGHVPAPDRPRQGITGPIHGLPVEAHCQRCHRPVIGNVRGEVTCSLCLMVAADGPASSVDVGVELHPDEFRVAAGTDVKRARKHLRRILKLVGQAGSKAAAGETLSVPASELGKWEASARRIIDAHERELRRQRSRAAA